MIATPCICARLRRAAQAATNAYDRALAPAGITSAQHGLLRSIERLGEPDIGALAADTRLDRSTLGRNLRLLQAAGLIAVRPGRKDRRRKLVSLTPAAAPVLETAGPAWREAQRGLRDRLGADGKEALFDLLERIEAAAEIHGD